MHGSRIVSAGPASRPAASTASASSASAPGSRRDPPCRAGGGGSSGLSERTDLAEPGDDLEAPRARTEVAFSYVYLLGAPLLESGGFGISGMQLGIEYTSSPLPDAGLKVFGWNTCETLMEFRGDGWPASGTGNTLVWGTADCQLTPVVVAGYFYVGAYSASTMSVVGWPGTGLVKIADCKGAEVAFNDALSPSQVGWISLGGGAKGLDKDGCNPALEPCTVEGVPVVPTTWGQLKRRYGQ